SSVRRGVRLEERPFGGFARGSLPVGCRQCTDGSKMVLFVTGICSFHCFYCPVSDEKMYKDVVFADEKRVTRDEDVLEEAHAIRATGAGITGGDPRDAVERTGRYIRLLTAESATKPHRHLYPMSTDRSKIRKLADAGRGPGRPPHPGTALEDDGPLLHERLQGWLAAPLAHQATRGERRASLGRHHGGRDPPEGNRGRPRFGAIDARHREDLSRPEGPHGRRRTEEAPRDRALDPRGDRTE